MDACSTFHFGPGSATKSCLWVRKLFSYLPVLLTLLFLFSSVSPSFAGIEFKNYDDSARPLVGPTLQLKPHVRQIVTQEEIHQMKGQVLKELAAKGIPVRMLDIQFISDMAKRGQIVATDTVINGKPVTFYGVRHSLNNISPEIPEFIQLFNEIIGENDPSLIVLTSGIGTSVNSGEMQQWGDVDINFALVDPEFTGDPEALRRLLPMSTAAKATKRIQRMISDYIQSHPNAMFTELKAGSPQPEPFHPFTPPKGEKWSLAELMAGQKEIEIVDATTNTTVKQTLKLEDAIRDDTYVKFDFYTDGVGSRKNEFIEVTACFRFGGLTPDGKVYLVQSPKRKLHFPPARDTTFFPDLPSFFLSVAANEFEYVMPTTARANQLMIGKVHEVMGESSPRFDKANKVVAARSRFWPDIEAFAELTGANDLEKADVVEFSKKVGNNPDVIFLANLLAETKAFLELLERNTLPAHDKAVVEARFHRYLNRLAKVSTKNATAIEKAVFEDKVAPANLVAPFSEAKQTIATELSNVVKELLKQNPLYTQYLEWVRDRFPYLSLGEILNRATLIAYPATTRVKKWYASEIGVVSKQFPLIKYHNPEDLHGTVVFAGNVTEESQNAMHRELESEFKNFRAELVPASIDILGSEGTYVGITFNIDPANKAIVRQFQFKALSMGGQPTRFLGNVHPHNTLFWIPKNATAEEREQFEAFKAWAIPRYKSLLPELFPDNKWVWSGVPMVAESNRLEAAQPATGEIPEKIYQVKIPAQPLAADVESGQVDKPLGAEVLGYNAPRDVFAAWNAPDVLVEWIENHEGLLNKMFPLLSFTKPNNAHIPLAYGKSVAPSLAVDIDWDILEPFSQSTVKESYAIMGKGPNARKSVRTHEFKGNRLVRPVTYEILPSRSLGTARDAVVLSFTSGEDFKSEVRKARKDFLQKIPAGNVVTPDNGHLHITIARVQFNHEENPVAKRQLRVLAEILNFSARLDQLSGQLQDMVKAQSAELSPENKALVTSLFVSTKVIARGNSKSAANMPSLLVDAAETLMVQLKEVRLRPTLEKITTLLGTIRNVDQTLVIRGIEAQPYTINARPSLFATAPHEIREELGSKYVKLSLTSSKSRSSRANPCAIVLSSADGPPSSQPPGSEPPK